MTFRFSTAPVLVFMALPVVGHAATVPLQLHDVSFQAYGLMDGSFSAEDLNGDGRISIDETSNITGAAYNDGSGAGGNWWAELSAIFDLEIEIGSNRFDTLTGEFELPVYVCGYDSEPDCEERYGADAIRYMYTIPLEDWAHVSQIEVTWRSYPAIPLPASLALLLGAVGALGAVRRRSLAR